MPIRLVSSPHQGIPIDSSEKIQRQDAYIVEEDLQKQLKQGEEYLVKGNFEEAEEIFRRILKLDFQNPSAHSGLGLVAYCKKNFKEAEKEFKLATQFDPNYAAAWNNLGAVFIARRKYGEAKAVLEKALLLQPDLEDALNQLFWLEEKFYNLRGEYQTERYPSLSLCMIVKNEEKNLPRALASVKNVVDEIIIVDTGSTDRTVEIAQSMGAKVYFFEWCDDFSAARNESLRYATKDWILIMDADDEMNEEDLKKLKLLLRVTDYTAFELMVKSYLSRAENQEEICYLTRVFRNQPTIRFQNKIHETVNPAILKTGGKIGRLKQIVIFHRGYEDPVKKSWKVHQRNLKILLDEHKENPDDLQVLCYLGMTFVGQGRIEEAKEILSRVVRLSREKNVHGTFIVAKVGLAQIALAENDLSRAIEYLDECLEKDSHFPDAYYWLGRVFHKMGDYKESLKKFQETLQVDYKKSWFPFAFTFVDMVDLYFKMADSAYHLGEEELGNTYSAKLHELVQNSPDGLVSLGKIMVETERLEDAEDFFRAALHLNPLHADARTFLFSLLLQNGKVEEAKEFLMDMKKAL